MNKLIWTVAVSSMMLSGCSSSGGASGSASPSGSSASGAKPAGSGTSGGKTEPAKAEPAKVAPKKLDKLGVTVDVPADGDVTAMGDSMMVSGGGCAVTIKLAGDNDPKTVEDGKGGAMLGDKGRGLKGDKTADGWIVTWENTGSMGDNYWLSMRREIAKKGYMCETMQSNEEQRKCSIAICNSIKP